MLKYFSSSKHSQSIQFTLYSQVNISSKQRDQLINDVERISETSPPSADLYSDACAEVMKLMRMDPFMRFRSAHTYEELFGRTTCFGEKDNGGWMASLGEEQCTKLPVSKELFGRTTSLDEEHGKDLTVRIFGLTTATTVNQSRAPFPALSISRDTTQISMTHIR